MNDPGLGDYDGVTDDGVLEYGDRAVNAGTAATRVAQATPPTKKKKAKKKKKEARKPKKTWKAVKDGPLAATTTIYILYYFAKQTVIDDLEQRLHGTSDPSRFIETSKFLQAGINITIKQDSDRVWTDLGDALHESGAIVVHMSHSERAKGAKAARNIRPRSDSDDSSADISVKELTTMLKTVNAKAFILSACATDGCIGKIKRDTAMIATDSGADLLTNTVDWSEALIAFLFKLVEGGTIADGLDAANAAFKASTTDPDDRFVLASGKDTMTLSP